MTNTTNTATVQALTAEVHVLMVGSRQVTLSVARQLDVIPLSGLTPFGRVRLKSDEYPDDWIVGANVVTGALCLSHARYEVDKRAFIPLDDDPNRLKPLRCRNQQPSGDGYRQPSDEIRLSFDGWPIVLRDSDTEDRHAAYSHACHYTRPDHDPTACNHPGCEGFHCDEACKTWDPRDYHDDIALAVAAHQLRCQEDQDRVTAAKALPLIVLAGLR
jgi:hypothetical protein